MNAQVLAALRWIARLGDAAILILLVTIAIGEGLPNPLAQPFSVNLLFVAMLAMIIGLIAA